MTDATQKARELHAKVSQLNMLRSQGAREQGIELMADALKEARAEAFEEAAKVADLEMQECISNPNKGGWDAAVDISIAIRKRARTKESS